jgi:hypothetical protein
VKFFELEPINFVSSYNKEDFLGIVHEPGLKDEKGDLKLTAPRP